MKKFSFFALAIAGMLFTACSDKDLAAGGELGSQGEDLPEGYMALSINLPTTPIVRAANDVFDDGVESEYKVSDCALLLFEGDDEQSAELLNAQAIILPFDDETNDGDKDNITTTYQATAQVKGHTTGKNLWALALLNYKEVMSIDDGVPTLKNIKGLGSKTLAIHSANSKGTTLADIRALATNANLTTRGGATNYFFMTNAVLSTKIGGAEGNPLADLEDGETSADRIFQLAYMDPSKIKETMEAAKGDPAGEIFVERAVAKATLRISDDFAEKDGSYVIDNKDGGLGLKIAKIEWTIDNIEPYTYVARNPGEYTPADGQTPAVDELAYLGYTSGYFTQKGGTGNYRFVGNATVGSLNGKVKPGLISKTTAYRTYWCYDPQYDVDVDPDGMLPAKDETTGKPKPTDVNYVEAKAQNLDPTPLYCYENTFDVAHQNYKNTTRAIIKVTLADDQTFYTLNGGQERYVDREVEGDDGETTTLTAIDQINTHVAGYIVNKTAVVTAIKNSLKPNTESGEIAHLFNIDYLRDEITGQYKITSVTVKQADLDKITFVNPETEAEESVFDSNAAKTINDVFTYKEEGETTTLIDEINKEYVVREYKGGEIFYEARFKHFAGTPQTTANGKANPDDLAPWNIKEADNAESAWETAPSGGNTASAYQKGKDNKTTEENYLGRYGMVRNNWYDVELTAIDKIGFPADPSGQVNNPFFDEPGTPDDNILEYISCKIHVLSWAKRLQSWGF